MRLPPLLAGMDGGRSPASGTRWGRTGRACPRRGRAPRGGPARRPPRSRGVRRPGRRAGRGRAGAGSAASGWSVTALNSRKSLPRPRAAIRAERPQVVAGGVVEAADQLAGVEVASLAGQLRARDEDAAQLVEDQQPRLDRHVAAPGLAADPRPARSGRSRTPRRRGRGGRRTARRARCRRPGRRRPHASGPARRPSARTSTRDAGSSWPPARGRTRSTGPCRCGSPAASRRAGGCPGPGRRT